MSKLPQVAWSTQIVDAWYNTNESDAVFEHYHKKENWSSTQFEHCEYTEVETIMVI